MAMTSYSTRCRVSAHARYLAARALISWGQNLFRTLADQHFIGAAGGFGEYVFEHKAPILPNVEDEQIVGRVFEEVGEVRRDGQRC